MVWRARAGLRRSVLLSPIADFLLFEGAEGALSRRPTQMCFFARLTGSSHKPAADTWTRRLAGRPEPITNSMRGAFRALWPLLMRGVWMEKNLAASGQHFVVPGNDQMLAKHLRESQTCWPEIKSWWARFCRRFSPINHAKPNLVQRSTFWCKIMLS